MTLPDDPLVSCAWLAERLDAPDIRVVDATWFMPADKRDAKAIFAERRIPGAIFFDIDEIADTSIDLPHMLPAPRTQNFSHPALNLADSLSILLWNGEFIKQWPSRNRPAAWPIVARCPVT